MLCDGYKWVSWFTFALLGKVSAEWSRCPGSMVWHAKDSVAPLRQNSAGWMPARVGKLSTGVGRRHPGIQRVWALWHQADAQYSGWLHPGQGGYSHSCCSSTPAGASKPPQERERESGSCEVTQGVGGTWATCLKWLWGIWARSRRAGFRCCIWLSAHV